MRWGLMAALVACACALTVNAFAKEGDKAVEMTLDYGTEAFNGLGGQFGATVGFGYQVKDNLQGRIDVSYLRSSRGQMEMNVAGTRVPVDLCVRYYYPLGKIDSDLTVYGQGGVEISFDDRETAAEMPSRGRTAFGGVVGAGAEYALDPHFSAVLNLQFHIIEDSYLSTGLGLSYRF